MQELERRLVQPIQERMSEIKEWRRLDPNVRWLINVHHAFRYTPDEIGKWGKWTRRFLAACEQNDDIISEVTTRCSPVKISAAIDMLHQFSTDAGLTHFDRL